MRPTCLWGREFVSGKERWSEPARRCFETWSRGPWSEETPRASSSGESYSPARECGSTPAQTRWPVGKAAVSVLIPAKNEAENIRACLASVAWADEAVVVDSQSSDGTAERAAQSGARVVQFHYVPGGPKKKNWALRNVDFRNEWILILDADERVTPRLAEEIISIIPDGGCECSGFYINRRFYFAGKWIRHAGYYPSWNLRLLRRGAGEYETVPDPTGQTGDNEVHEHILLKGKAGWLREPLDHYAYPDIFTFVEKHNRYSTWEALVQEVSHV